MFYIVAAGGFALAPVAAARGHVDDPRQDTPEGHFSTRQRTAAITALHVVSVALYGKQNWWQDGFNSRFRTANEGWFGQNTYSGGADKLGHFYLNYAGTRLFARAFEWSGNDPAVALQYAALLTIGTFGTVEVLDGFSKKWRFSKEDAILNLAGTASAILLERHPALDRIVDLRFHYRRSRQNGEGFDPFGDYSGQTYVLVVKANGFPTLRAHPLLRYIELSAGYGTRGYPAGASGTAARNLYLGLSLNLSEVLNRTTFQHTSPSSRSRRATETALEFVQVPGTALFTRRRLGH